MATEAPATETSVIDHAVREFERDDLVIPKSFSSTVINASIPRYSASTNAYYGRIPNVASSILGYWLTDALGMGEKPSTSDVVKECEDSAFVVQGVSLILKPGESTLLLGPSSSGKTTLMRHLSYALSGQQNSVQEGSVRVGAADPSQSPRSFQRTTAFVDQSDTSLTPVLTVEETVRFARHCAEGSVDFLEDSINNILKIAGLDHVKTTVVGNADIRGVSGGQKRRVKLLEQAVGDKVTTMFYDEISNGLASSDALSIAQVIKVYCEKTKSSAMTSLLQPSADVYGTFDRLVLLTPKGTVAYSGPTQQVEEYFESLGFVRPSNMDLPDFFLRLTDDPEAYQSEETAMKIATSDGLVQAFKQSDIYHQLVEQITLARELETEALMLPALPDFAIPASSQVAHLIRRGLMMTMRDPSTFVRIVVAIIFGVFVGTLFLHTPLSADGTFVRSGYILTLIFLVFLNACTAPLEALYNDRPTFYVHRTATFYRTSSYYIAQAIYSAPVVFMEAIAYSLLSFFAVGMNSHGGWGYFYFLLLFMLVSLNGLAISRIVAYSLPNQDIATTLGSAILLVFILTTGNSPQYMQLPSWLRWISWISPPSYCYEGAIISELLRSVGNVTGEEFGQTTLGIPRVPYGDAPPSLDSQGKVMVFDVCMLIALMFVFDFIGCIALHLSIKFYGPTTRRYQVTAGMSLSPPPWSAKKKKAQLGEAVERQEEIPAAPKAHLLVKDIFYDVDIQVEQKPSKEIKSEPALDTRSNLDETDSEFYTKSTLNDYGQTGKGVLQNKLLDYQLENGLRQSSKSSELSIRPEVQPVQPGRLRLLNGVTASFAPGTMTALMGSSGAGKSTLLDVLAGYKTGGHVTGEININQYAKTEKTWRSIAGYCEQVDLHTPSLTVFESLVYATRMRLRPFSLPDETKVSLAKELIALLELEEFADTMVGDEAKGEGLPKHARKRLTVGVELASNPSVLFADEPTSGLDSLSGAVVVSALERAAKTNGITVVVTIHQPSRAIFQSFDNLLLLIKGGNCVYNGPVADLENYVSSVSESLVMSKEENPADFALDVFAGPRGAAHNWIDIYKQSDMARVSTDMFTKCSCDSCKQFSLDVDTGQQPLLDELYLSIRRELTVQRRTPTYMATRIWWTIAANFIIGVVYFQSGDLATSIGSMFFYLNVAGVPLISAIVPLIQQRAVFYRESMSGTYRRVVYGIAVQTAEIPFNLMAGLLSFVIFYFLVGLKLEGERIFYFLAMTLAAYWVLPTFGQLFAVLSPNIGAAVGIGALLTTLFTLTMGFLIPPTSIPPWYIWLYWVNPMRYILQGLVVNEAGGGPAADELLSALGWGYDDRWWYCFVAVILFGLVSSIGVALGTRISWLKR